MAAADAVQQQGEYAIRTLPAQCDASHDSHAAIATAAFLRLADVRGHAR
jgi:hypothetical protein